MTKQQLLIELEIIMLEQRSERKYIKTKPYSQTLTEKLHKQLTQYKLFK